MGLQVGDTVEVLRKEQILATLDAGGRLEALPFMPEMLQYCGRRFTVTASAHKTCDTASMAAIGMRQMEDAVHLGDLRCDGSAHGGCQAGCLLFWKTDWLRKVEDPGSAHATGSEDAAGGRSDASVASAAPCTDADLVAATTRGDVEAVAGGEAERLYVCQATELVKATRHLPWWSVRQYVQDVRSGNVTLPALLRGLAVMLFNKAQGANRKLLPRFKVFLGARKYPFIQGRAVGRTPKLRLDLMEGTEVRVRPLDEIERTLGADKRNRGLSFDREMVPYCGQRTRVARRVERVIDEHTGRMLEIRGDCLVLEDVVCKGLYHHFCPRKAYPFWREIWLEPEP
ncbi:MAG: hypothetical protein P8Z81_03870 [Deinococcales bacterium]|jgi:hypothetical protein